MRSSVEAILLVLSYEQLSLVPYRDVGGRWTSGWGHLIGPSDNIKNLSREEANAQFIRDWAIAEESVAASIGPEGCGRLSPNQFGACTSLAFNIGGEAFATSSVARAIRLGRLEEVPADFMLWTKVRGKNGMVEVVGLVRRRQSEVALWNKP